MKIKIDINTIKSTHLIFEMSDLKFRATREKRKRKGKKSHRSPITAPPCTHTTPDHCKENDAMLPIISQRVAFEQQEVPSKNHRHQPFFFIYIILKY